MSKHEVIPKRKWLKAVIIALCALLVAAAVVVGIFGGRMAELLSQLDRDEEFPEGNDSELGIEVELADEIYNIALFGVDARDPKKFTGNSDSIMILSVNRTTSEIKMVSVMRDSLVPIPRDNGVKNFKINAAYSYGGPTLAVKTLNTVYDLNITDYATVNFYGMADIIDAVGGIEVDVLSSELDNLNCSIDEMLDEQGIKDADPQLIKTAGKHNLNGIQAVAYARIRKVSTASGTSNDFGRVERQQYVMQQLLNKALTLKDLNQFMDLAEALVPYVKTSLTNSDIIALAKVLMSRPTLVQTRVPNEAYIIDRDFRDPGASTVYYNYEYAAKVIHAFLYEGISQEDFIAQNEVDKTPWYN